MKELLIAHNRNVIYKLPDKYKYLNHYMQYNTLRKTLLNLFKWVKDLKPIFTNKCVFFADNAKLTKETQSFFSKSATSRYMNLLCALGLIHKYNNKNNGIQKNYLEAHTDATIPMNGYYINEYTSEELELIEKRAERLYKAGITPSNFSYNTLCINGLNDIARAAMPNNNKYSPLRKQKEYTELFSILTFIIDEQGYCTRQQLINNLLYSDKEIDKLLKLYRKDILQHFDYKPPTRQQVLEYGLTDKKYIYTHLINGTSVR